MASPAAPGAPAAERIGAAAAASDVGAAKTAAAAPPLLCQRSCGFKAAVGLDGQGRPFKTCCRGCATGHGHDASCARAVPVIPCKKGCGYACAAGFNGRGKLFDTCCRGCATGGGTHDESCARLPSAALDLDDIELLVQARSAAQKSLRPRRRRLRRLVEMVQQAEMWDPIWGEFRSAPGKEPSRWRMIIFAICPCLAVTLGLTGVTPAERRLAWRRFLLEWAQLMAFLQLLLMIVLVAIDGHASAEENPMIGPSVAFLNTMGAKNTRLIVEENQWWRLVSPVMLHAGWLHLLGNLLCTLQTGVMLEVTWGHTSWLLIYVSTGIFATLSSCALQPLQLSVGASGALCGIIGAWFTFILVTWNQTLPHDIKLRNMQIISVILTILLLAAMFPAKMMDHAAHGGGVVFGAALAMPVFANRIVTRSWRLATRIVGIVLCLALVCGTWALFAFRSCDIFDVCFFPAS